MVEAIIDEKRYGDIVKNLSKLDPILVMGDVGLDKYTYGEVTRISPEAPVAVIEVTREWYKLGLAANINDNLRELGIKSTILSVIGNDLYGEKFLETIQERGLPDWGIIRENKRTTTLKERVTTKTQQICRIDYESKEQLDAVSIATMAERGTQLRNNHSALIIEDYGKGLLSEHLAQKLIAAFKEQNKLVTVDPSRSTHPLIYRGASLLKPNFEEAKLMVQALGYRENDLEKIAKILSESLNIPQIVITLGPQGMALFDVSKNSKNSKNLLIIPTVAKEVFDVSGAGDTAIAILTSTLAAGATLPEAAWMANCGAGVVVAKRGTATVSQKELSKFYHEASKEFCYRYPEINI